ncbi:MAG: hypothetical protein QOH67_3754 [Hyphomicrobiales bacterium]|nr:hypothetical protein [Hyphomicrobiales bacterium]
MHQQISSSMRTTIQTIHDFDDEQSDFMILSASKWYGDLGNARSKEMNVFAMWWSVQNPKALTPEYLLQIERAGYGDQFKVIKDSMSEFNRADRLKAGLVMLDPTAKIEF